MQVSNGTGQGSEYRVGSNSGGNRFQASGVQKGEELMEYVGGLLGPGESGSCDIDESIYVEFWIEGRMVASASFPKDPGHVMLVNKEDSYSIAVPGTSTVAA
jgi:hypothetical protein